MQQKREHDMDHTEQHWEQISQHYDQQLLNIISLTHSGQICCYSNPSGPMLGTKKVCYHVTDGQFRSAALVVSPPQLLLTPAY